MTTFALIHGAYFGAWCWDQVIDQIGRRGFRGIAPDLPIDDAHAGLKAYTETVLRSLEEVAGDDVVVVGNSMGGLVAPLVAAERDVRAVVFLCAPIPTPGSSMLEQASQEPDMMTGALAPYLEADTSGLRRCRPEAMSLLCPECDDEQALRFGVMLRAQASTPMAERFPLDALPAARYEYVLGSDDRLIGADWARRAARERLGVEARELPVGHAPMLSHADLVADVLLELASPDATGSKER